MFYCFTLKHHHSGKKVIFKRTPKVLGEKSQRKEEVSKEPSSRKRGREKRKVEVSEKPSSRKRGRKKECEKCKCMFNMFYCSTYM